MTRKRRRLIFVLTGLIFLGFATLLILTAFEDSLVFFYSPTEVKEKQISRDHRFRIGGLVEENSIKRIDNGLAVSFRVTDLSNTISVTYKGILPDLFREGQGVVTEGSLLTGGLFKASEVLAKHDENYMPAEVAEALKKTGQWREP